jgi:SNF2 family DNA or RNA helicase
LPIKFDAPGTRSLLYCPETNFLVVEGPFADKDNLKRMGGIWPGDPKGWKWFFTIKNLEMLIDKIPFDFIDKSIHDLAEAEMKRIKSLEAIKEAALKDLPISLRIPGIKPKKEGISLRNYQKLGVQFCSLVSHGFLLGDTMGLGKSVQAIGMALWRKKFNNAKRCLVIAPASLKYNWEEELEFWTNESFTIIDGTPSKREKQWENKDFITVVNPELIVRDFDDVAMLKEAFDIIIVDEIHMLKSWKSKRSKKVKELKTSSDGIRIGLSGTPIDGKLEDLHSIFEFLVPGLFTTRGKFLEKHAIRDEWNSIVGYMNVDEIRETIKPFFLRRLKEEVAKELPEKIFQNVYVNLSPAERKVYNAIKDRSHSITEESEAITAVLRARQFCDAPVLVDEYPEFGSKYESCMEMLEEVIGNGHKVLIFSMFEQMVDRLYVSFEKNGWKSLKVTGKTKKKDRPAIARQFNEDPTIDICVMDEAGSTGLNFQKASYVFHYDDNWSPAIMKQRTDRAHRITTEHTVNVINFVCLDTIEDHVRGILRDKDILSAAAIGDDVDQVSAIKSFSAKEAVKLL